MLLNIVGRNLKKQRKLTKLSLEDFGGCSNTDAGHVGRIERGQHNATLATLKKIIAPFSLQLHELFNESDTSEEYLVLSRFVHNNFPYFTQTDQPYRLIDELSQTLLESLTVKSVERGALPFDAVTFSLCETRERKQFVTYGITACYEYARGQVVESVHDLTLNKDAILSIIDILRDLRPTHTHFREVMQDFADILYSE